MVGEPPRKRGASAPTRPYKRKLEFGITTEEAAKLGIEDLITRAETSFSETIEYVIEKNRELYHRLAK